jgi:hypothetical protein
MGIDRIMVLCDIIGFVLNYGTWNVANTVLFRRFKPPVSDDNSIIAVVRFF